MMALEWAESIMRQWDSLSRQELAAMFQGEAVEPDN
jgi:hypothetical protein